MSAKTIYENEGKQLLFKNINSTHVAEIRSVIVTATSDLSSLPQSHPWLLEEKLVVKPDQLIKRRGKLGLVSVNVTYDEAKAWICKRFGKDFKIGATCGILKRFIIEPFVAHNQNEEFYICIHSQRYADTILFHHEGGINIGDVDAKAVKLEVPVGSEGLQLDDVKSKLLAQVPNGNLDLLAQFILSLYELYQNLYFTYLEVNPLVVTNGKIYVLDLAAKLDQCAEYICKQKWGDLEFPAPFGRENLPEEAFIADLDARSGASLKLTILNKNGRIWTMVAGGGASVIYADTICDLGGATELANYGEYSGAPSEQQTYDYARTLLDLMTRTQHPDGKVLIIGGGIANFTNVAATFKGIVRALREYQQRLIDFKVSIFVRRGGPNYQEGLRVMRQLGSTLGVAIHVFGPETHMTSIVGMALGKRSISAPENHAGKRQTTANFLLPQEQLSSTTDASVTSCVSSNSCDPQSTKCERRISLDRPNLLFNTNTKTILWGMQAQAVQRMLDFDFVCSRKEPSVVAMIYPFTGDHKQKFYYGHKEILIPIYKSMKKTMDNHKDASVLISFASLRSAYESTVEAMTFPQIKTIAIIAEGIPENLTRTLIKIAKEKNVTIIGPATVGGIKPGCFKIGNTGGMMDNILASKLYRPGSVAYVSRSGGMSNELNNIISLHTDGVYEGVAIGGDRYPGTTFMDHVIRYQDDDNIQMIVVLGEVGGVEEYEIIDAVKSGRISKPMIAWCIGTCAKMFTSEVQFGHAGACANAEAETAIAKNKALQEAMVNVPNSFDDLGDLIEKVYTDLVNKGVIIPNDETAPPTVPMDYSWARELGLIRKPASFMTSMCDERGQELIYAGMPITEVFKEDMGIGGVLSLLWFQRRLPRHVTKFLEMCLMVTADHGPAVSGAHNTIVTTRAGKDLVSSLTSGLLTIGDKFGGALDAAAKKFMEAYDSGSIPMEFVNKMRKEGELIPGIGHRVKSINNPDMRVVILKRHFKEHFPISPLLDYALEVEKITTSKKPNLILNVDGFIGVAMVDLFNTCGCFTQEETREFVEVGALNALFVLGRSIGFIGHYLDQKRLKQGLYRHPWDDISYVLPEQMSEG